MSALKSVGRSSRRWRFLGVYVGILLVGSLLLPVGASAGATHAAPLLGPHPAILSITLSSAGDSPASLGLRWTNASDLLFASYDLYSSTSGSTGPWTHVVSITDESKQTYFVGGLSPGSSYWWQASYNDTVLGATYSNVVSVKQPAAAVLTASQTAARVAHLSWTDSANYSGLVAFQSYRVQEVGANGSVSTVANVSNVSTTTWDVSPLVNDTTYRFKITTTDVCSGASNCGSSPSSAVPSNQVSVHSLENLTAAAGANATTIRQGGNVSLTCTGSGGKTPYSVAWQFGDGNTGSGSTTVHQYLQNGTFAAACTLTDSFSSWASSSVSIHVTPPSVRPLTAAAGANTTTIPQGGNVTLSCTGSGGGTPYSVAWQFGDGTTGSGATTVHQYLQNGTFTATCTVTDSYGTQASGSVSIQVTPSSVGALAAAAGSNATTIPQGGSVTLSCTGSGGRTPYSVAWQFGDGNTGSGATTVHQYLQNGTFTATCTITDASSSRAAGSVSILVTPTTSVGPLAAAAGSNTTTIPQGGSVTLSCLGSGGRTPYTVTWQFGDGNTGTGVTTVHQYLQNGTFLATCTLTDAFGGRASSSVSVHVTPLSNTGGGPPGGSTPPTGGNSPAHSLVGPVAAAVLFVMFLAAVAWLAFLVSRRRRDTPPPGPESSGNAGRPIPPPVVPAAAEPPAPPEPVAGAPRAGEADIDSLMDELEDASAETA